MRLGWTPLLALQPQGVLLADRSGCCLEANPAAARILGLDRDRLLATPLQELLGEAVAASGVPCAKEVLARAQADREPLWLELSSQPGPEGSVLWVFHDITEAHRQKVHLERMTQLYAALSQVNQAIVWFPTRDALLDKICEVMVDFGKFRMAWIGWNDPLTHEVSVASAYGEQTGYLEGLAIRSDDTPRGRGATGSAIRTGRPCIINDFLASMDSQPWHAAAVSARFAASAAFPISMEGEVVGALTVYAPEKDLFGEYEIGLLNEAVGDISFALDHLALEARRKEAEAALDDSRARLQKAERVASFGNWELDLKRGKLRASEGAHLIYGLPQRALDLSEAQALVLREDRPVLDGALKALLEQGQPYNVEFRIRRAADGAVRSIHSVAEYEAERHTVFGVMQDITEVHEAREALKASLDRLQKITERVPGVVYQYRIRPDGTVHMPYASEALRQVYGLTPEQVRDDLACLNALHHPEDAASIMASIQASTRTLTPWRQEYRLKLPDGSVRHLYGDAVPEREEDGSILWTGYISDITERKQVEAHLQRAQKMESLGNLASGIAHDMNNVLGAILGLSTAELASLPRDHPLYDSLSTIRDAATRGGGVVRSLLTFARPSPKERRLVEVNELLLEEARLLQHTTLAKVRLELDLAPDLRPIQGDAGELSHAVMNLCINAVDAMGEHGTLTLRTRNAGEAQVEVTVEDTGCGMPPEVLSKAMDPFFTTKAVGKGTGLGLAMVFATAKAHGGEVALSSEVGQGTRVSLRFPALTPREGLEATPPLEAPSVGLASLVLLLVDDDELIQKATRMLLEVLGHQVTSAGTGEEALALLDQGLSPDAVILDLNMPGLGGKGTLPRLRERCPAVPVFLATGRADDEAMALVAAHPFVTLLPKPFSFEELRDQLRPLSPDRG